MKTKRRQELKSNDLAIYLQELREFVRANSSKIIMIGVVAVCLVAVIGFRVHSSSVSLENSWQAYQNVARASYTPDPENAEWLEDTRRQWEAVVESSGDRSFKAQAIWGYIDFCQRQFLSTRDSATKTRLLEIAERHCRLLMDRYASNPAMHAAALRALASVEENRYVLDGDAAHKERARQHLEEIRDTAAFTGTPFQDDALTRLNDFEGLWQPMVLAEAPKISVSVEETAPEVDADVDPQEPDPESGDPNQP